MKKLLFLSLFVLAHGEVFSRTATTKEEIKAESQVQGTRGDLGEKNLQKQEDDVIDPLEKERVELEPEIIKPDQETLDETSAP